MRWLLVLRTSVVGLLLYLLMWQAYIMVFSHRRAHGLGYYQAWSPIFYTTGGLLVAFGLYLRYR